jgi:T-complex protein 1 subunit delta|mmetsp:Transcript_10917/g.40384  ORF Transcript_10917/g.40384 Transcript_10917/m.40384 type:complete len:536 (+) Transcript_10917:228-1835(+)
MVAVTQTPSSGSSAGERYSDNKLKHDIRMSNMNAAKKLADAIRTSLGPRGMDKMLVSANNDVTITNDGATILNKMEVTHPAAKMLVELAKSQDIAAGDGTTSVTVLCGSLLNKCIGLLERGVHPTVISDAMGRACDKACEILQSMAIPLDIDDREALIQAATTSLGSKVVAQYSNVLAPIAVDAVLKILDKERPEMVDLRDIKILRKSGGTIDDTEMVPGLILDSKSSKAAGGPTRVENAKIALIQFCISPPKTDMENSVVVSDYQQMDRILKEERNYIIGLIKKIKNSGCNVLLIQKSILRDAVTDLSLHYLAKAKILVVRDVERDDVEFIAKTLKCAPVAHVDQLTPDKLGHATLVASVQCGADKMVKITGIENMGNTVSVLCRGSNKLVIEEADRSLHDALCVIRCLVQKRFLIVGGGAPEVEVSQQLGKWGRTLSGMDAVCVKAFADALEVIPYTLAENAGLNPIEIVTELRNKHATTGNANFGINVRKGTITDILLENVVQPLLVSTSALSLATECVRMILKIDDICPVR